MANAGPDKTGVTNVAVSFDGSGSTDSDGTVTTWWWQYGDGASDTKSVPTTSHVYTAAGTYSVSLWVRDNSGAWSTSSDSASVVIATGTTTTTIATATTTSTSTSTSTSRPSTTSAAPATTTSSTSTTTKISSTTTTVPNQPPVANAGPDQLTQTLITLTFNGSGSTDPDGTIVLASWTFGDGATAPGLTVTHSYATPGTYTATLTVVDNAGASGTDTAIVTVQDRPPTANAGPNVSTAPSVPVILNGSGSSDPDGTIVSYAWTFGDGMSGSGATPTHTYAVPGTYVATLTVTDNNGAHGAASTNVNVSSVSRWAKAIGSTGSDNAFAVAGDAAGDTFVGGTFQGAITIGSTSLTSLGGSDWFIAKYSSTGVLQWAQREGGTADDLLDGLAVTTGGDVVASGHFAGTASFGGAALVANGTSDMVVAKYAGANGAHRWSARYGGIYDDAASAVAVDGSDNVYLTGFFSGSVNFGGGVLTTPYGSDLDVFVAKFDGNGNPLWSKHFPNSGNDRGYGIATDGQRVAIAGSFSNGIDFGGGMLGAANGLTDAFVTVLDASTGAYQWTRQIGAPDGNETAYGVTINANSDVVACGVAVQPVDFGGGVLTALGKSDGWVAAYVGSSGAHHWSRRLGGAGSDSAYAVAAAADGSVVVAGGFDALASFGGASLTPAGSSDGYVAKYTSAGAPLWVTPLGGIDDDLARSVAVAGGAPVAAGYFYGAGVFDTTVLTSAGASDAFVVHLAP